MRNLQNEFKAVLAQLERNPAERTIIAKILHGAVEERAAKGQLAVNLSTASAVLDLCLEDLEARKLSEKDYARSLYHLIDAFPDAAVASPVFPKAIELADKLATNESWRPEPGDLKQGEKAETLVRLCQSFACAAQKTVKGEHFTAVPNMMNPREPHGMVDLPSKKHGNRFVVHNQVLKPKDARLFRQSEAYQRALTA